MIDRRRAAVAVVLIAVAAGSSVWLWRRDPIERLVRAMPRDGRVVEARLTGGFAWAPLKSRTRSAGETPTRFEMRVGASAWQVLDATSDDPSPAARRAAAMALLLEQRFRPALEIFEALAQRPDAGAEIWSDLAAARCEASRAEDDQELLAGCLAAADAALRLNDRLPEARFNRALALEHLGLRDHAREAWLAYASLEPDRAWGDEARERVRDLVAIVPFRELLESSWQKLAADPAAAREVARTHRQDARQWGETKVLGDWAYAHRTGDRETADKHLRIAREFGDEIERLSGEAMLKRAVDAIERAGPAELQHLVEAHIAFREGQTLFKDFHAQEAQPLLARAAAEFDAGGSPLALVARYYVAHTFFVLNQPAEARAREQQLLAAAPPEFHAHRAHLLWHLGLGYQAEGDWGKAMESLRASLDIFDRLGEQESTAAMHGMVGDVYERTGNPAAAWKERIIRLRNAGRQTTSRLQQCLDVVGRSAITRKQWPVALSFLDLASDVAGRVDRPLIEVETRVLQARVYAIIGGNASASIGAARIAASRIKDAAVREGATADVLAAEGIVIAANAPQRAIGLLDSAIHYHQVHGRRIALPDMFLARGRAFRKIGVHTRAAQDFESGIAEVELYRTSLPQGQARWGVFNAAEELFEDAMGLALADRDPQRAFRYAERARARELSESLGVAALASSMPDPGESTVLLEFVALPDRLVTFVLDRGRLDVVEQLVDRDALDREATAFVESLTGSSEDVRARGRALYDRLIAPVATHVAASDAIVVVPGPLAGVPFAALTAPDGAFLVERHAITSAPSAAVFTQLATRTRTVGNDASLLVMADPITEHGRLRGSEKEAKALADLYGQSLSFTGAAATTEAFLKHAAEVDVIHLGAHGLVPVGQRREAALALSGGTLDLAAISSTRLPRTAVVVLAACSTSAGAKRAEGTISVARAFLEAGVPSVIATLWPVDDAGSAQFFPLLHRYLRAGRAPAAALRSAQMDAIDRRLSPAVWAAVQSMGSGGVTKHASAIDSKEVRNGHV